MLLIEDDLSDTPIEEFNTEAAEHEAPEEYGEIEADPPSVATPPDLEDQNPQDLED